MKADLNYKLLFMSDAIYHAVDAVSAANHGTTNEPFIKLVDQVCAVDPKLGEALHDAALDYTVDQVDAAFTLGYRAATEPARWLFEPINFEDTDAPRTFEDALTQALTETEIPFSDQLFHLLCQMPDTKLREEIWATIVASWTKLSKEAFDLGIGGALPSMLVLERTTN